MKILFLDQSGNLGGAELCLRDIATSYREQCLVGLFADGPFKQLLADQKIPVQILTHQTIQVRKDSRLLQSLTSVSRVTPLIYKVAQLAKEYDLIYANTQKALVVGAIASALSNRPLVYHLHDILSLDHFSRLNRQIAVTLANRFASLVIANSQATQTAFVEAGGRSDLTAVVYNGFHIEKYGSDEIDVNRVRQELGFENKFIVGHFSRLSPWKGQHVLLQAIAHCPPDIAAVFVGDALFGEHDYVEQLQHQVQQLKLSDRVKFLGFRSDVSTLMSACNLIAHTSTAPEPFGRVIVEAMLCQRVAIAAKAGGAIELIEHGKTGWLCSPHDFQELADLILTCRHQPDQGASIAQAAQAWARQNFNLVETNRHIHQLLNAVK